MKIHSLQVSNFRGISNIELKNLEDMVVIAGPNGCGKSCILDAIRLLKSIYGGYQANEVHQWLSEFHINFTSDADAFSGLMQDKSKELRISAFFELHEDERAYLRNNAEQLVSEAIWRLVSPELQSWASLNSTSLATQLRSKQEEVESQTLETKLKFLEEISSKLIHANIWIDPSDKKIQVSPSRALEIIFSIYKPNSIGVIEYNGAKRHYERENVQGININLEASQQLQRSQHALYNHSAKYSNVKSEMASSYVREALALRAGVTTQDTESLTATLQNLFSQFFPDKQFLGPVATKEGYLKFPVKTLSGAEHDLNELSSGEKEVLFGYLRLRNAAPRNSVILLDEPELHLNPRLLRGLPDFYHKNLGLSLNNQIWLVTHSDALLREAVGSNGFSVFHMSSTDRSGGSQIKKISMEIELERAIVDLVGDLASYRPGAKVVILEGEDSEFDKKMMGVLFPKFSNEVNIISGGNKSGVLRLRKAMSDAAEIGNIPVKFYSITDADLNETITDQTDNSFQWDVYHIENYLLEPSIIREIILDLRPGVPPPTDDDILFQLKAAAEETIPSLVRHVLQSEINQQIVSSINTKIDPKKFNISDGLYEVITSSKSRLDKLFIDNLTIEELRKKEEALTQGFGESLENNLWLKKHRGRDILKRFAGKHVPETKYETFRNLVMSRMALKGIQPLGMKAIIDIIIES
ncbi:AAA family ATPase [Chitinimonas naiadis]